MTLQLGQYAYHRSRNAAQLFVQAAAARFPDDVAKSFLEASKELCEKQTLSK